MGPPGTVASLLLKTLQVGMNLCPGKILVPEVASMKLVDMAASKLADDDPTLVFYVDVPSEMISLMLSTLMNLISQVADSDDLIQYRIVTFQVQVMGGGANVVRQGRMVEE
jgi:hypothetical protein